MQGPLTQALVAAGSVVLGFGIGWLYKCALDSRKRLARVENSVRSTVRAVVDDLESSTSKHERSLASLRAALVDGLKPPSLDPHICASDSYELLLTASQRQLSQLDPGCQVVPPSFLHELAENRDSAASLTTELLGAEGDSSVFDAANILARLEEMQEANHRLRGELEGARQAIAKLSGELETAREVALEDALTKLPNRRAFDQRLAGLSAGHERYGRPFCLLILDLDHFKRINDRHGHDAGDAALSMAGMVLRESCRAADQVFRIGGEEFAILAPETTLSRASVLAERMRKRIELSSLKYQDTTIQFTCSIGFAEAGVDGLRQRLFQAADEQLYTAKREGRNRICAAAAKESESSRGATAIDSLGRQSQVAEA